MTIQTELRMQQVPTQIISCNVPHCTEKYEMPLILPMFGPDALVPPERQPSGWVVISPWPPQVHMLVRHGPLPVETAMHCCPKHAAELLRLMNEVQA